MNGAPVRHQVVILGGGFGGLHAAQALRRAPVEVTLIDKRNFHLFQPLLYQVATGGLSPGEIASPLRYVVRHQKNSQVLLGEVIDIDAGGRRVILRDGEAGYDTLIAATGASHHYFGHEEWARYAPTLKTIEDATEIRSRILLAFERAEREPDADAARAWLTFVVVGGGPTGVELAGALGEIARDTLRHDFRRINPAGARILLIEGAGRMLPSYPPDLSRAAEQSLISLGVRPLVNTEVTEITGDSVVLKHSSAQTERVPARTVLWAAGVAASPIGRVLAERAGAKLDRAGRVIVESDLTIAGHPEIIVIGDLANCSQAGRPLPGVAPVAIQQGRYAAELIRRRVQGSAPPGPFRYRDRGSLATIGRAAAVADFGRIHIHGMTAWLAWLFIHLMNLIEFDNRLLVMIEWAYNYITRNRGARLITGK